MNNRINIEIGGEFCSLLGLIFITLKLTGFINWSWLWVLAPFWIPFAITGIVLLVIFILMFVNNNFL